MERRITALLQSLVRLVLAATIALVGACAGGPERAPGDATAEVATAAHSSSRIDEIAAQAEVIEVEPESASLSEDEVVCTREVVTGSHQRRSVCRSRAERSQERAAAQDWMRGRGQAVETSRAPAAR